MTDRPDTLPNTLIDWLRHRASLQPKTLYARYLFLDRAEEVDFQSTLERTQQYAALYASSGVAKGSVVLVILEHQTDLMPALPRSDVAGCDPRLPAAPEPEDRSGALLRQLEGLIERSEPVAVMTSPTVVQALEEAIPEGAGRPAFLNPVQVGDERLEEPAEHGPEDVCLIQYSSGSTGLQKGAALSHRAILAEIEGVGEFFEITEQDSFFSWVPLYHDWGLVCVALHALQLGTTYTLQAPIDWVRKPVTAFQAVDRYKPTIYYHPNFAFNLMTQRIKDAEMEGVDLSSVRICCNGAEPCFYLSHKEFAERFQRWGLPPESLAIVYGMAEVTNSVIAAGHKEPIQIDRVRRKVLQEELRAEPVEAIRGRARRCSTCSASDEV